jgi:hypothetical protein
MLCQRDLTVPDKETMMLWTLCLVLMLLWDLGRVSAATLGGWLHLLPLLAITLILLNVWNATNRAQPVEETADLDL